MKRCASNEDENGIRKKAKVCDEPVQEMIRPSDVPGYLHDSEFYKSLNLEDDEEFHMPSNLMKRSTNVESLQDLADLLRTIRFWGVDVFPSSIVKFALTQEFANLKPIFESVENEFPIAEDWLFVLNNQNELTKRMEAAMGIGEIKMVHYLEREGKPMYTIRAIVLAAEHGSVDCLEHALKHSDRWTFRSGDGIYHDDAEFENTVANGHVDSLKLLYQYGFRFSYYLKSKNLAQVAAANGQLECLKFLYRHGCAMFGCAVPAASFGNLACLKYVMECMRRNTKAWASEVCEAAARGGHLQCLKYLHELGCPWTEGVCVAAATVGSLDCLQYYCEHGGAWQFWACHAAALHGHFACLEYAHSHGCPLVDELFFYSTIAYRKRFKVNNGPAQLVEEVAKRQHWDCVSYLIRHNYPLTNALTTQLARRQKKGLLDLAVERGCLLTVQAGIRYAKSGDLEGLKFALENGSTASTQMLTAAARKGHLECLTYAHQHGCPWSKDVCEAAARGGHVECLQYAREHDCP